MARPVRQKCRYIPYPANPSGKLRVCRWEVAKNVTAIDLDCAGENQRSVVTRNMDNRRDRFPWRVSFFNLMTGKAEGHGYGKTPAQAMNLHLSRKTRTHRDLMACKVMDVRTR